MVRRDGGPNGNLASLYTGDGTRTEDWHSWREPLLAPFDGVVLGFQINPVSTPPGVRGSGRSRAILFQQLVDGEPTDVHVAYVHVREVTVSQWLRPREPWANDPRPSVGEGMIPTESRMREIRTSGSTSGGVETDLWEPD